MKLSCTPISFSGDLSDGEMDFRGFVDYCAELGMEGVDLLDTQRYPWVWGDPPVDFQTAARYIHDSGLSLAAYGCGNNFAKRDAAERAKQVESVKTALREAAEMGAPVLRIFGGHLEGRGGDEGVHSHNGMALVKEGIEACLPVAEECGVIMGLENHGALPGHAFELEALFKTFDSPWLRCTFDCGNFIANNMLETEDPVRALDVLMPYIEHVHVKDFFRTIEPQVNGRHARAKVAGQGHVPLRQLTAMMEKAGYEGFYTLEYEADREVPSREGVAQSIDYLRKLSLLHEELGLNPKRPGSGV